MALVLRKNRTINTVAVTPPAYGNGITGFVYGAAQWLFEIKETSLLIGAAVTCSTTRTSGTGVDANNLTATDQWASEYDVAYGYSYIGLRMPTVRGITRRVLLQRGHNSVGNSAIIKWNDTADYGVTGSPTVPPVVAGEMFVLGSSPGDFQVGGPGSGSYILHGIGYSDSPQGFMCFSYPVGGGEVPSAGHFFGIDPLKDGTYDAGTDDAQFQFKSQFTPTIAELGDDATVGTAKARARLGLPEASWKCTKLIIPPDLGSFPASARTAKKPLFDARYVRVSSPSEYYGISRLLKLYGPLGTLIRTLNVSSTKDHILCGPLALPWDGTEPL